MSLEWTLFCRRLPVYFRDGHFLFCLFLSYCVYCVSRHYILTFYPQASDDSEGTRLHLQALGVVNQAWDLYYGVFKKINKDLPQVNETSYECGTWEYYTVTNTINTVQ